MSKKIISIVKKCLKTHNTKTSQIGIIILFVMAMSLFMIPNTTNADTAICTPDCPQDRFENNPIDSIHFSIGQCNFVMWFYYRKACGQLCDFHPVSIRCYSPGCEQMDMMWVIDVAMVQLLLNRGKNEQRGLDCYPDQPGQCRTNWRISKGACWKYSVSTTYDPRKPLSPDNYLWVLGPCSGANCCYTYYQICMNQYTQLIITPIQIDADDCGTHPDPECFPVCEN